MVSKDGLLLLLLLLRLFLLLLMLRFLADTEAECGEYSSVSRYRLLAASTLIVESLQSCVSCNREGESKRRVRVRIRVRV